MLMLPDEWEQLVPNTLFFRPILVSPSQEEAAASVILSSYGDR